MTQRNPMNDRYRNSDKVKGVTRKSASTLKPSSKAGATVHVKTMSKKEQKAKRRQERAEANQRLAETPIQYTPTEKKARTIFWVLLFVAIACLVLSWIGTGTGLIPTAYQTKFTIAMIIVSYGSLAAMLVVDLKFVRPARKRQQEAAAKKPSKKIRREVQKAQQEQAEMRAANGNPKGLWIIADFFVSGVWDEHMNKVRAKQAAEEAAEAGEAEESEK